MLGSLAFQILPTVALYFLPETGPGRASVEKAAERAVQPAVEPAKSA
jgi:hypothetical protein